VLELTQTKLVLSHLKHSEQAWCESAHALATDFLLLKKKQQLTVSAADMIPSFGCVHCQEEVNTNVPTCTGRVQMEVEIGEMKGKEGQSPSHHGTLNAAGLYQRS